MPFEVFAFTCFVAITYGFGIYMFSALAPEMGAYFGFGAAGIGVLSSAAQAGNMACALVSAFLARLFGPVRMIYLYLGVLLVAQITVSQTESFWILLVALTLIGGVASATWVAIAMATQIMVSEDHRAKSLGLMSSGTSLALLINGGAIPVILDLADWRSVWLVASCFSLVLAGAFVLIFRKSFGLKVSETKTSNSFDTFTALLERPAVFTILILFLGSFSLVPLQTFMTSLLTAGGGWEIEDANRVWVAMGLGGIIGGFCTGWIADRTSVRVTLAVSFLAMASVTYTLAVFPELRILVFVSVFTIGFSFFAFFGLAAAYLTKMFDPATASVLLGVTFVAVGLGSSLGNVLTGWVIRLTEGYVLAFGFLAVIAFVVAFICWAMPSDRR